MELMGHFLNICILTNPKLPIGPVASDTHTDEVGDGT